MRRPAVQTWSTTTRFLELTKAAEGKPESQFDAGTPPDWRDVRDRATELFERTRDLRVAVLWLRAAVNLDGFGALPIRACG